MSELNLPNQFDIKVDEMILAIKTGRSLHAAKNIKSSGNPLEQLFRSFLEDSLPSTNKVASGYFYDGKSRCSNEVDVLIYEEKEAFRLDPGLQEQHYVPFTSVSIMGQIKNSANELENAIDQVQKSIKTWSEMRSFRGELLNNTPYQFEPLSFIVCGETRDNQLSKLEEILKRKGRPYVDYILLLDKGLIVTGNVNLFEEQPAKINFLDYRNSHVLHLCKPDNPAQQKGIALLWFYFALVTKLNLDSGNNLRYQSFCKQIEIAYPLISIKELL